jgi:hypothetical protein
MSDLRRTGLTLLAALLALSLAGLPAAAKKHRKRHGFGTQVTLTHPSDAQFAGRVSSKLKGCRKQRVVNLFYTDPATGQRQPLGVDRTNKKGRYEMDLPKPAFAGTYQTQVPKVSKRGSLLCRAGKSNAVTVPTVPLTP